MMRIAHKLVKIVFVYLRTTDISKGGSFYKVLEGDLEESRRCMWVVGEGVDLLKLKIVIPLGEWIFINEEHTLNKCC